MSKYLIYKISGGLNHMLIQINNAIEVSKISKRKLIIDCYSGAFCNDFNKYFNIPNLEYYTNYDILKSENLLSENILKRIIDSNVSYRNGEYFIYDNRVSYEKEEILLLEDDIVTMSALKKNFEYINPISVNSNIVDYIKNIGEIKNFMGVHYRNTDMKHDILEFIDKIKQHKDIKKIYLSTDDHTAKERFNELLNGEYEIIQYTNPPNINGKNIHYGHPDKDMVILNAIIDIFYLVKSDVFIPSRKSSFSKKVNKLRDRNDFF